MKIKLFLLLPLMMCIHLTAKSQIQLNSTIYYPNTRNLSGLLESYDFNNDGINELLTYNNEGGFFIYKKGEAVHYELFKEVNNVNLIAVTDLDGDKCPDLLFERYSQCYVIHGEKSEDLLEEEEVAIPKFPLDYVRISTSIDLNKDIYGDVLLNVAFSFLPDDFEAKLLTIKGNSDRNYQIEYTNIAQTNDYIIKTGYFNQDEHQDIALFRFPSNDNDSLTFYFGTKEGDFIKGPQELIDYIIYFEDLIIKDQNLDGRDDIIFKSKEIQQSDPRGIRFISLNDDDEIKQNYINYVHPYPDNYEGVIRGFTFVDTDHDNIEDLIINNEEKLLFFKGLGNFNFELPQGVRDKAPLFWGRGAMISEYIDGDDQPDFIILDRGLHIAMGHPETIWEYPEILSNEEYINTYPVDINDDGIQDFISISSTDFRCFLGEGNGQFKQSWHDDSPIDINKMEFGDINEDGNLDLITMGDIGSLLPIYLGNGDGTFKLSPTEDYGNYSTSGIYTVADFDLDGHLDVIHFSNDDHWQRTYLQSYIYIKGNGKGQFELESVFEGSKYTEQIYAVDINNDGYADLMSVVKYDGIEVWINQKDGTFEKQSDNVGFYANFLIPNFDDVNNDGFVDVISRTFRRFNIYIGDGNGGFTGVFSSPNYTTALGPVFLDFNGDQLLDFFVNDSNGYGVVWLNQGNNNYKENVKFPLEQHTGGSEEVHITLINGDQKNGLDFITYGEERLRLFINNGKNFSPPSVKSISAQSGSQGDIVTIKGANFSAFIPNNKLMFGYRRVQILSATRSTLTFVVPKRALGVMPLTLFVNGIEVDIPYSFEVFPSVETLATDLCDDAPIIPVDGSWRQGGIPDAYENLGSDQNESRPIPFCVEQHQLAPLVQDIPIRKDAWLSFNAPDDYNKVVIQYEFIDTSASDSTLHNVALAVYTSCESQVIACKDQSYKGIESLTIPVESGKTYLLRIMDITNSEIYENIKGRVRISPYKDFELGTELVYDGSFANWGIANLHPDSLAEKLPRYAYFASQMFYRPDRTSTYGEIIDRSPTNESLLATGKFDLSNGTFTITKSLSLISYRFGYGVGYKGYGGSNDYCNGEERGADPCEGFGSLEEGEPLPIPHPDEANFMNIALDESRKNPAKVWCQTIKVEPEDYYVISAWVNNDLSYRYGGSGVYSSPEISISICDQVNLPGTTIIKEGTALHTPALTPDPDSNISYGAASPCGEENSQLKILPSDIILREGPDQWRQIKGVYQVPSGITQINVCFEAKSIGDDYFYGFSLDDISVRKIQDPSFAYIDNLTCELSDEAYVFEKKGKGKIAGRVFNDENQNCEADDNESWNIPWLIKVLPGPYYIPADENGYYQFDLEHGNYEISQVIPPARKVISAQANCLPPDKTYLVNIRDENEIIDQLNFPNIVPECPDLQVDVTSNPRIRCFEGKTTISYSNLGYTDAENVEIEVQLPKYVIPKSSTIPWALKEGTVYVFQIGTLEPNEFGQIIITDSVACVNGILGLDQCTQVSINSATQSCQEIDNNWAGADLNVEGTCVSTENELINIKIQNIGKGDMEIPTKYRIWGNDSLWFESEIQLLTEDSLTFEIPTKGQTIHVEVEQVSDYPGQNTTGLTIEGCASTIIDCDKGFANQHKQSDDKINVEIDCQEIVGSYDPNDKLVSPEGFTDNHYVNPGTRMEYTIRFQNTGTFQAFSVVVVDTLSLDLDIETFEMMSASHDYRLDLRTTEDGQNILTWTFPDINLPDSTTNEPESHGYIKFKISPKADLAEGTQVENFADIFFDFNDPIRTNTTLTTFENYVFPTPDTPVDPCTFVSVAKVGDEISICETEAMIQAETPSAGNGFWTLIQGAGSIASPESSESSVTGLSIGENIFRWQVSTDICADNYQDLTITVNATPEKSTVENPEANILQSSIAGDSYHWYLDGELMPGQTSRSFEATESGDYQVQVLSNGCISALSDVLPLEITSLEATLTEVYGFKIHPNPTDKDLQISFKRLPEQNIEFTLRTPNGAIIQKVNSKGLLNQSWESTFDLESLPKGVYLLEINTEKGSFIKKIVKQ